MRNLQQQQQESEVAVPESWDVGRNNCITAINVQGTTPLSYPNLHHHHDIDHPNNHEKPGWKKFLSFVGPGFLVSLAYLDPGNLETDLQAGANHGYELLWVVLIGLVFALIIQSLAANLGVSTGKHLSELCKAEYPKLIKYCLWLLAETAVIAADIPEGGHGFECSQMYYPPIFGLGRSYWHNLFLHSALVLSRKVPNSVRGVNDACRYFLIESGFALLVAFLINVAVVSVSGAVCSADNLSSDDHHRCNDLNLNSASFLLQIIVISWILGIGIIGINVYYLTTAFVDWLIHNDLPKVGNVFIGIIVFPLMAIYVLAVIYLTFRKDTVVTYIEPEKNVDPAAQSWMESGLAKPDVSFQVDVAPYRQDLADIPFPE
ncbi:metal transporter Nramp6-like [Gossypium australe]|uniref:Metal transporter Nramp6-like n=1 Tax=Gossypium australe TaxID=47621 RepID=A0A5B6UAH6_9ROSI|nr:metal transporter Nramp6-like [Gossypium australe]